MDLLVDRLYTTLDRPEQASLLKEIGEIMAADLQMLPLNFTVEFVAARRGVRAIVNDFVSTLGPNDGPGLVARNAHLWDRD